MPRLIRLLTFGLVSLLGASLPRDAAAADKPNVVLIVADDLGWADLGCYGADLHETPHLDRLAAEGTRFTTAYAAAPICSPTRASIHTGKFPARLNITIWREGALAGPVTRMGITTARSETDLPQSEITLAEALREQGYLTAHVGKWHLGAAENYALAHGFDIDIGGTLWGAPPTFFYPYRGGFGSEQKELRFVPGLPWGEKEEYLTDRLTHEALAIIDRAKDRPFFLHLAHHAVHTPIEAPPELVKKYEAKRQPAMHHQNATYAAMVETLDTSVGRVLQQLADLKLADRTLVLFVSDNGGFINNYKGQPCTSNFPLRSGKGSLYEGGIRVPLLIRAPGTQPGVCDVPVITTDLYATCLELCGAKGNAEHDGLSLTSLLRDPQGTLPREELCFHYPHFYQTTTPVSSIRRGQWKLLHYYNDGHDELYNLAADAVEADDRAAALPDQARALRRGLDDWLKSVDAKLPVKVAE